MHYNSDKAAADTCTVSATATSQIRITETVVNDSVNDISLKGKSVAYTVYRRKTNKNIRISVTNAGALRISVPWNYPNRSIPGVLKNNAEWILSRLKDVKPQAPKPPKFANGAVLHFLGNGYRIWYSFHDFKYATLKLEDTTAHLSLPAAYRRSPNYEGIEDFVTGWYRHQASRYLPRRIESLARRMGVQYSRVRFKDLRGRWGSCSAEGNLNFNIRLMMLPKRVIDYIIIHELAHIRELNHSAKFWAVVQRHCRDFSQLRQILKERAALLD